MTKSNEIWGDIIRVKRTNLDRPELLISLNFLPGAERLTVVIMKAKNLECDEVFVKFYLIQNGKRIKKKKTNFSKADHSWNEAFTFNLPSSSFNNSGLEVSFRRFSNICYMTFPLLALRFGERIGRVERHWLLRNWLRREHRKGRHNRTRSLARHDPQSEEADALLASNRAVVIQSNQNLV